jgi:hypothetical protein
MLPYQILKIYLMDNTLTTINQIDDLNVAQYAECECEDILKHIQFKHSDLTIISQNIRSIYCNLDNLIVILTQFKFNVDIVILSECRLHPDKPIPSLNNYTTYSTTHHLNQNDGVVVYVRNTHKYKVREIKLTHASCLEITILDNKILGVYRSPSMNNAENFICTLNTHLESIKSCKSIILTGDININLKHKTNEQTYDRSNRLNYLTMLAMHGVLPGHLLPTRDKACLDHVMIKCNKDSMKANILILDTTVTDHAMVLLKLDSIITSKTYQKTKTHVNFANAVNSLSNENLSALYEIHDPNCLTNLIINKIRSSLISNTITTLVPRNNRIIKPWITLGILRCIRNRNNMQKKLRSDPENLTLKITYRRYRNFCNGLIKKLKRKYDKENLIKASKKSKSLWRAVNDLTNRKTNKNENLELLDSRTSPRESVNAINNYFSNIGRSLAETILSNNHSLVNTADTCSNSYANSFVLYDTNPNEVYVILSNLKSSSAPGWDNIPTQFLKLASGTMVPLITYLANLCFRHGTFPNSLKQAIVTPVFKSGNRSIASDYRPISVLPAISKILEKLINTRLINYLNKFKILSDNQYGFRQGISTEDAVSALSSLIIGKVDGNKKCIAVFLDLKKAFDTVSVPTLINTLESIGIRGIPLSLLSSYLHNRRQKVKIGEYFSDECEMSYGVPQGSVLGPTLFLIYINQLCKMRIAGGSIFTYADDTAIVFSGSDWDEVQKTTEVGLAKIARWLQANLLTLNTKKTNYICFTNYNRTQPDSTFSIKIHTCNNLADSTCSCSVINKVEVTKYLGIMIDQRLTWHVHTELIMSRTRKLIWIFKNLRHIASKDLLNQIYVSLAQSVLEYCISIWGGSTKIKFLELERAQRAVLKVMHSKPYRFPTNELYDTCDLLSVRKLYVLHAILRRHKKSSYKPETSVKRRKPNVIPTPLTNSAFAKRQYAAQSAKLYNIVNKQISIFPCTYKECKTKIIKWLKTKNYIETENLLLGII